MKFLNAFVLLILVVTGARSADDQKSTVGREGAISVVLANPSLQPIPAEARAALVVRIASREVEAGGTRYDLRWLGAVPGVYNLTRYLVDVEGKPLSGVSGAEPVFVHVLSLLPPGVPGDLVASQQPPATRMGGYQLVLLGLGIAWLAVVPLLWRRQRRAKKIEPMTVASVVDQLREVIERARTTGLDTAARARLERLLLAYWRERLGLQQLDAPAAMLRLREHAEAGALLRQLDAWLHAPPGRNSVDVAALLAPYSADPAVTAVQS